MSYQQLRQSELFAGENWQLIYKAFSDVNFKSYDFDTIRQSMVEYIQRNYPEDFNDWIENQELIFIIDLLAFYGQSLAFRTELNARENFMDTAERKESVLRLARMLSYNPKRNIPARGLLKLNTVKSSEEIRDSFGTSLQNVEILWNDPSNTDWYEHFILIINSALTDINPFGMPVKDTTLGGVKTQLYQINNVPLRNVVDEFESTVNGTRMRFESIPVDIDTDISVFKERTPDPLGAKFLIYRTDGAGNESPDTGFFTYFKQGSIAYRDFEFKHPEENRVVNIDVDGINELDVWVQEISDTGLVVNNWTRVPSTENIAFNSIDRQERNIFQVITKDNDRISIKFGDGRFGRAPVGLYRVWYRVSNGLNYQIKSVDMQDIHIVIPYTKTSPSGFNQEYQLTMTFSLEYEISNRISRSSGASVPSETTTQTKQNASQVYYTQNRMVNGEDYNILPLSYGNLARKVKSINRTYSGQSRFIDINDPTGKYQNTNIFSDDGILYMEYFNRSDFENIPSIKTPTQIIQTKIQPLLNEIDLRDFFIRNYPRTEINNNPYPTIWYKASGVNHSSTGEFRADETGGGIYIPQVIGTGASGVFKYLKERSLIKFYNPLNVSEYKWATIEQVSGSGIDPNINVSGIGPVLLNETIDNGWVVDESIYSFRTTLDTFEVQLIENEIFNKSTFALRYDEIDSMWRIVKANNIGYGKFSLSNAGNNSGNNLDNSWLLLAEYLPGQGFWRFSTRNLRYVFESVTEVRFFFTETDNVIDATRKLSNSDIIRVLKFNTLAQPSSNPLSENLDFAIVRPFVYNDGYIEPRRIQISFTDKDKDGSPDNPDIFDMIVDPDNMISGSNMTMRYIYQEKFIDSYGYEYYKPVNYIKTFSNLSDITSDSLLENEVCYVISESNFYERIGGIVVISEKDLKAFIGRNDINFQWKHYASYEHRIDPAITNIIDTYVLTSSYYETVSNWVNSLNRPEFPEPPTIDDLRTQFSALEDFKMVSDEIVWQSAKFKLLFGEGADEETKAQFKIVKVPGTTVSDNEIKERVISAINEYFNIDNWSFGESFYYTELSAYIHQQLSTVIASVVIVPNMPDSKFGVLFSIRSEPDQLFLSTASVNDVIVVDNINSTNMKIGK